MTQRTTRRLEPPVTATEWDVPAVDWLDPDEPLTLTARMVHDDERTIYVEFAVGPERVTFLKPGAARTFAAQLLAMASKVY